MIDIHIDIAVRRTIQVVGAIDATKEGGIARITLSGGQTNVDSGIAFGIVAIAIATQIGICISAGRQPPIGLTPY